MSRNRRTAGAAFWVLHTPDTDRHSVWSENREISVFWYAIVNVFFLVMPLYSSIILPIRIGIN